MRNTVAVEEREQVSVTELLKEKNVETFFVWLGWVGGPDVTTVRSSVADASLQPSLKHL